mgnify:FL=1
MKNRLFRIFALLVALITLLGLAGCGNDKSLVTFLNFGDQSFDSEYVNGKVCENDRFELYWDNSLKRVSFADKQSGAVWGQIPAEAQNGAAENGVKKKNHPQLESALQVNYQDPKSFDEITLYSYTGAVQEGEIYTEKIDNGLKVIYEFTEFDIAVPVEYTIGEDSFAVTVDPKEIAEGEDYKVTSVALEPFLCGLKNNSENSFLFFPDGSGAIVEPVGEQAVGNVGSKEVYGGDSAYRKFGTSTTSEQIKMPIFAAKKGDSAVLGVISSGAPSASINWNIGSNDIGYSTVYPSFRIRGFKNIERPENFITTTTLGNFKVFDKGILTTPVKAEYFVLSGEKASVYGMAEKYRDYLKKNSGFEKSENKEVDASFKIIGATLQPDFILGIPTSKLFPLTTAAEAEKIANELSEKIGSNINLNLLGFGQSGVDAQKVAGGFKTAGKLGNMEKLYSALDKKGINAFLDYDVIAFNKSGGGFSKKDAAVYSSGMSITYTSFDTVSKASNNDRFYLLSRSNLSRAVEKIIKVSAKKGVSGISLNSLGTTVYSDYANQETYLANNMENDVAKLFAGVKKGGYKLLSTSANSYAAVNADYVNDAPIYSSDHIAFDFDVPFYELVFKGYVPLSSVSINLCSDKEDAILRCVESGISPSYTVYGNFRKELVTNDNTFIFGSSFDGIKEDIYSTVNKAKDYLKLTGNAEIVGYEIINKDVRITRFAGGGYTVVNYGETPVATQYGEVAAKGYIYGREG